MVNFRLISRQVQVCLFGYKNSPSISRVHIYNVFVSYYSYKNTFCTPYTETASLLSVSAGARRIASPQRSKHCRHRRRNASLSSLVDPQYPHQSSGCTSRSVVRLFARCDATPGMMLALRHIRYTMRGAP